MDFLDSKDWEEIGEWVDKTLADGTHKNDGAAAAAKSPSVSGSDPDGSGGRRRNIIGVSKGKVTKRKSRAATKNTTTFFKADPENFRRMVQEVTGFRVGDGQVPVAQVVKPEPQRLVDMVPGSWPTLDTSAYVVGGGHRQQQQQQQGVGPTYTVPPSGFAPVDGGGFCFESFSFPALES